jgi:sodium transport system permease protein
MTIMLTRSPKQTLSLKPPVWWTVPVAVLLALAFHPVIKLLQVGVERLYPMPAGIAEQLEQALTSAPSFWQLILLVALMPAICEELAFRGFILSGFRHLGHKWRAIALSSLLFGVMHTFLQQSILACITGAVLGYVAVQTGSIFPCMAFHFTNNALVLIVGSLRENENFTRLIVPLSGSKDFYYQWWVFALGLLTFMWIMIKLSGLRYARTEEESLEEKIERRTVEQNA